MRPVGLGDLAAAAGALMAAPERRRAALMQTMLLEAERADAFRAASGRLHPGLGNGTLMAAALAHPRAARAGPDDKAWLGCLAQAVAAVIAHRSAGEVVVRLVGDERFELPTSSM